MSGPKVDIAELRRQEMERLTAARKKRLSLTDRINHYINEISNSLTPDRTRELSGDVLDGPIKNITLCQQKYIGELKKLLSNLRDGDELLDLDEILRKADNLKGKYDEESESELKLLKKLKESSKRFQELEKERQALSMAKRKTISRLKAINTPAEIEEKNQQSISEKEIKENVESFFKEISEYMKNDELSSENKNSILQISQDLKELSGSSLDNNRKLKRIGRLFADYEKMTSMIKRELEGKREAYKDYKKECFDIVDILKPISSFNTLKDIEAEILKVRTSAEKEMSRQYIRRQIDEVMAKHGYDVIESDMLMEANANGQILYGVDKDSAINVFVSGDNQVTMRVVGVGFDSAISPEEDNSLYEKQCAFCSMHPQITAELAMRGVILHGKNHMPPDKKFNKKIQLQSEDTKTTSRAKKELRRTEKKVMHRE